MRVPARLADARILQPLRHRDYALLVGGSMVSLDPARATVAEPA